MEFMEAMRLGGYLWDDYDCEFGDEVSPTDWVLLSQGAAPIRYRVLIVFDESFLEIGETREDAVLRWQQEASDIFDVKLVEDVIEQLKIEEEAEKDEEEYWSEDEEAQYYEDEAWRDDL